MPLICYVCAGGTSAADVILSCMTVEISHEIGATQQKWHVKLMVTERAADRASKYHLSSISAECGVGSAINCCRTHPSISNDHAASMHCAPDNITQRARACCIQRIWALSAWTCICDVCMPHKLSTLVSMYVKPVIALCNAQ